jgi:hypothetical protein
LTASDQVVRHPQPGLPGHYFLTLVGSPGVGIRARPDVKIARPDGGSLDTDPAGDRRYARRAGRLRVPPEPALVR